MKGYIFEYYQYVRYLRSSMNDIGEALNHIDVKKSMLTFGDYDRLKINEVADFSRYRDLSTLAKTWVGNRQSILLYELDDKPPFTYKEIETKTETAYGFQNTKTDEFDNHLFFALTEFHFRCEKQETPYEDLLKDAREGLEKTIQAEGSQVNFMLMGTLGAFGIAVLWFSDQYTEILRLISHIRKEYRTLFWAAHTTISKNPRAQECPDYEERIEQIKGGACLQITSKVPVDELGILKKYGITHPTHTSGEYDVAIDISAAKVYRYFENTDIFNHSEDSYQQLFLQTRLILGDPHVKIEEKKEEKKQEKTKKQEEYKEQPDDTLPEDPPQKIDLREVDQVYEKIRGLIEENIDKTAGLVDTLDSLLCDYRYNVVSVDNERWAEDFSYIFYKNLQCIVEIFEMKDHCGEVFMELLRFIMNNLKQQIFHVAESKILNFEIPKCHLRYTGQEDSVLFCYMGIIKEILGVAYRLESCNKQSEIVPLVTVDVVPVIESDLYFDKTGFVDKKEENQAFKILSLNLPHVTFYDIPAYMQYMYHEIYHYIVPKNRELRDYHVGILLTNFYYYHMILENLKNILHDKTNLSKKICKFIQPLLYTYILHTYPEIHREITHMSEGKADKDATLFVADVYKNTLLDYLKSSRGGQIWKEGIRAIWNYLNESGEFGISKEELFRLIIKHVNENRGKKLLEEELYLFIRKSAEIKEVKNFFEQKYDHSEQQWEEWNEGENYSELLNKIMDGIKEAAADIPMIRFCQMPFDDYLLYYSNNLKNNLMRPEKMDIGDELKEWLRLGMIFTNYAKEEKMSGIAVIEKYQESYRYKYIAKYLTYSSSSKNVKEKVDLVKKKIPLLLQEADNWLNYFKEIYAFYSIQMKMFPVQLSAILAESDVKGRLADYDFQENADRYFKKYREAYCQYADSLKKLWAMCMRGETEEAIDNFYQQAKTNYTEAMFSVNIKIFQLFQNQSSLKELHEENQTRNAQKKEYGSIQEILEHASAGKITFKLDKRPPEIMQYTVHSMLDFWDFYARVVNDLEKDCINVLDKSYPFWYRGQNNCTYGLLPSLMRKNICKQNGINYLSQYQRQLFEEFKYRADGAPEIMDRSFFNISDYLTLMQHYSVSTTLMDWSEDIFTALYFSMDQMINHEIENAEQGAAVYVFSPHLYNDARKYMMKEEAGTTTCTEKAFAASMKTVESFDKGIPNIAAPYNEKLYDMFLLGNLDYETRNFYGGHEEVELHGKQEMAYLPTAVYTSRLNPRIRAQSGIFLAYNLYAEPSSKNVNKPYEYLELEHIQEYYIKQCTRKEDKVQFLYKITIAKKAVKEFADALSKMGISKERIYPELSNIGERVNFRKV